MSLSWRNLLFPCCVLKTLQVSVQGYSNSIHEKHNVRILLGIPFLRFLSLIYFRQMLLVFILSVCSVAKGISISTAGAKNRRRETFTLSSNSLFFISVYVSFIWFTCSYGFRTLSSSPFQLRRSKKKKQQPHHIQQQHHSNLIEAIYVKQLKKFP